MTPTQDALLTELLRLLVRRAKAAAATAVATKPGDESAP